MHLPLAQVNSSERHVSSRKNQLIFHETRAIDFCLLQAFSSLLSEQSGLSSHIQVRGTHSPAADLHVNSSAPHTLCPKNPSRRVLLETLLKVTYGKLVHLHHCRHDNPFRCHIANDLEYTCRCRSGILLENM